MFSVGDIVEWAEPDCDDVVPVGIVEEIVGMVYHVRWLDDSTSNACSFHDLKLISKVS